MTENPTSTFTVIRRILSYIQPYKKYFWLAFSCTVSLSALSIFRPLLIKSALDKFIIGNNSSMLFSVSAILLSVLICEAIIQYFYLFLTGSIGQKIIRDLRIKVFKHILQFQTSYFDKNPIGMLVTRNVSDIEALADVFSQGFIVIMGDILTLIVFVSVMLTVNWKLALLVFSTIPLLIFATRIFKRGVQSTFHEVRNAVAELNTFTQEHIQGMRIIQLFSREDKEMKAFEDINNKHRKANIRSIWYYSVFFPVVEILSSVSIGLLIFFAGIFPTDFAASPGEITFFIMLTNMMFRPIRMLADRLNTLQMGMVASERVFKVLDTVAEIENSGTVKNVQLEGKIEFENVYFEYLKDHSVLNGINFSIEPGKSLAVVGNTGAGKSTLINLLGRFYEINAGEIRIDDKPIQQYDLYFLRKITGIVLQDTFLFSDSIYNNIALYDESVTMDEVIRAAKEIEAHDFIMSLPGGYNFNVGERGQKLSAGQRQLIAFIRVCVFQPAILILDEATSAIDTQSEELIKKATQRITKNRTSIIIAHRLATIQNADEIMVMENGTIVEKGNLSDLLKLDGKFSKLYRLQYKNELLNKI